MLLLLLACTGAEPEVTSPPAHDPESEPNVQPLLPGIPADPGRAVSAYVALLEDGCDLQAEGHRVWTPIEAKVLETAPFVRRGFALEVPELQAFFAQDAPWQDPRSDRLMLPGRERACAKTLRHRGDELRARPGWERFPIELERALLREPEVFGALQDYGRGAAVDPWADSLAYKWVDGEGGFLRADGIHIACDAQGCRPE